MKELVWTKEPPKEPGWYWLRTAPGYRPRATYVEERDGFLYALHWSPGTIKVDDECDAQWAGPIPTPQEATP